MISVPRANMVNSLCYNIKVQCENRSPKVQKSSRFVCFRVYMWVFSMKMRGFGLDKPEQSR